MVNLSISNIGWTADQDDKMYGIMKQWGYVGLEIAPTRIFMDKPYEKLEKAEKWAKNIKEKHGFSVPSMQSIWYGRRENIFSSNKERDSLLAYTKRAVDFAETIRCGNLVFGCPRNRSIPDGGDGYEAVNFFKELGDYAYDHHTVIAVEANPRIYYTNFLNTTEEALNLIRKVNSKGFLLNLDTGTMIENGEKVDGLKGSEHLINHVHISEPGLNPIRKRSLHRELAAMLQDAGYQRFVSIEVQQQENIDVLGGIMEYVKEIFW